MPTLPKKRHKAWRRAVAMSVGTFIAAGLFTIGSQIYLSRLRSIYLAFLLLLLVIMIGILFDIIGVAITAVDEVPFHSRAARKLPGAAHALHLIRRADQVANFCSDVIGDICGILSGGISTAIALSIILHEELSWLLTAILAGMVAALTVGIKTFTKKYSINEADSIVYAVGKLLYYFKHT
jgi:CBS domain containing-hemolysin-like protein